MALTSNGTPAGTLLDIPVTRASITEYMHQALNVCLRPTSIAFQRTVRKVVVATLLLDSAMVRLLEHWTRLLRLRLEQLHPPHVSVQPSQPQPQPQPQRQESGDPVGWDAAGQGLGNI